MQPFTLEHLPMRVVFGRGVRRSIPDEMVRLGKSRALVLSTPNHRGQDLEIANILGEQCIGVYDKAVMHVPKAVADRAVANARKLSADCTVAVGGGSTIGLAKWIAHELGLPILAVPTTFAGSEMTAWYGITDNALKHVGLDPKVMPRSVLYDPELVQTMPPRAAGVSGFNAIAHAVEALYSKGANPMTAVLAEESIRILAQALPEIVRQPEDPVPRNQALYGAMIAGHVMMVAGDALHHKLCAVLGGTFNMPHAEVHTVLLPHAVAYNSGAAPAAMSQIERALESDQAAQGLFDLAVSLGAPTSLGALGLNSADLLKAAEIACAKPSFNPRPIQYDAVLALLNDAFVGRRPNSAPPGRDSEERA